MTTRRFELIQAVFVQSQKPNRLIDAGEIIEVADGDPVFTPEWIERVLVNGGIVELDPLPEPKPEPKPAKKQSRKKAVAVVEPKPDKTEEAK